MNSLSSFCCTLQFASASATSAPKSAQSGTLPSVPVIERMSCPEEISRYITARKPLLKVSVSAVQVTTSNLETMSSMRTWSGLRARSTGRLPQAHP